MTSSQKKTRAKMCCASKGQKQTLINSGDSVAFQKGQISVIAWLEKKHRKPVLIASATTDPASPPVTVSRKQNSGRIACVPCPQAVKNITKKWEVWIRMMHYVLNTQQPEWQDVGGSISFIFYSTYQSLIH